MLRTSDVFTPAKLPTFTDVDRSEVSSSLARWVRRGGYFVSVLGTTKLGKTTLVKTFLASLPEGSWSAYLPGQTLSKGRESLWSSLATLLGIPTSKETGLANSDKATWAAIVGLGVGIPGLEVSGRANLGEERQQSVSTVERFTIDPERAVKEAIFLLRRSDREVVIAIDDFHFVSDENARREIVLALRPLTDEGCSVILSTIPGGESDAAFQSTNVGGRRKSVHVPSWDVSELKLIATKGLEVLRLSASDSLISDLATESFGSPQIMQQLCLDLCEVENSIYERDEDAHVVPLAGPHDRERFFRALEDDEALAWLKKLAAGPNPRKKRKKRIHPGPPEREVDGYQLILLALHELSTPTVTLLDLKSHVGSRLGIGGAELNNLALELKARTLGQLAGKETTAALEQFSQALKDVGGSEEDDDATAFSELLSKEAIPQPVLEVRGEDSLAAIRIVDPLLSYMVRWHPEIIEESGRK